MERTAKKPSILKSRLNSVETEKFYEIKIGPSEVLLRVQPPSSGKRANLNEIQKELSELEISFRMDHLFDIYRRSSNQFETLTTRETTKYEILVQVSPEGQEATMTIIAPQIGEDELTPAKIKGAMEKAQVEKGILYDVLKKIMAEKLDGESIVIARGKPSKDGDDGRIEYHIETDKALTPAEDNRVDYKEMNLIKNVDEGDLIATIYPPTKGENGYNVRGKHQKGKNGKKAKFSLGLNTTLSEDGTQIHAVKAGFVVLSGHRISIEDVFEVPNVDGTTGNIRFSGVVRVKGQVEDNFIVEANKGIEVYNTVGKAHLKSRGDIVIGGGALGATIKTSGNVTAKFFNECQVQAGEDIIANDYILHSTVQAGHSVLIKSTQEGFINGGLVRAGESVWTGTLGSEMSEERTLIEVGVGFHLRNQFEKVEVLLKSHQDQFEKISKNLRVLQHALETKGRLPPEQDEAFEKMLTAAKGLRGKILEESQEYGDLFRALAAESDSEGYIFAANLANAGVKIQIKRFKLNLVSPLEACAFRLINGELKAQDYGQAKKIYKLQHGKKAPV